MRNIWQPNEKIEGRYSLVHLIGRGGVSEVWLAVDTLLQRKVAIKTVVSSQVSGEDLDGFLQGAQLIAKLKHPGISAIYDVGRDSDYRFIIMEYVEGRTLSQFEKGIEFPLGYGIRIALQVCKALLYAHQNGIVHRDIRPHNILIESYSGDAKLTGFDIAENFGSLSRIAGAAQILSSPAYKAPEQIAERASSPQSDIYSLGITLYELFTGRLPFQKQDVPSSFEDRSIQLPKPPNNFRGDIPPKLSDIIIKMLQPDPANRIGSISEIITILEELSEEFPAIRYEVGEQSSKIEGFMAKDKPRRDIQRPRLKVFLCHAIEDKTIAREHYVRLKKDGFAPWLDEEDLLPGQDWDFEVRRAVKATDIVIIFLSQNSVTKTGYVQKEIRLAIDVAEERPDGTTFIIPVRLENCDVPDRLRRLHWVDLFTENGYPRLVLALKRREAQLYPPPQGDAKKPNTMAQFLAKLAKHKKSISLWEFLESVRSDFYFTLWDPADPWEDIDDYLSILKERGLIEIAGEKISITKSGLKYIQQYNV